MQNMSKQDEEYSKGCNKEAFMTIIAKQKWELNVSLNFTILV